MSVEGRGVGDVVLGLAGFRLVDAMELDGELELLVETDADVVGCRACGVRAVSHGRRDTLVRDVAFSDRATRLRWRKRVWRCHDPDCEVATWTEISGHIAARAGLTERAKQAACIAVGRDGDSVAGVARAFGVGWDTVMKAVWDYGAPLVDDPGRTREVAALGLDETVFLRANRAHHTVYVTGLVDVATGRLLDVVEDRTAAAVAGWLSRRGQAWRDDVGVVAIDPHRGYANAVETWLPDAVLVVDHFHAIKLANAVVDEVRRRVQQETLGHRGRKHDPLYGIRRTLLTATERLTPRRRTRLQAGLTAGDPRGDVATAWNVKEALRAIYRAGGLYPADRALQAFYAAADASDVAEAKRLARTVRRWEDQILAWHVTRGASNGLTEATNLLAKKTLRIGHGFRNFANYRLRLLLARGVAWHTPRAARLRGRSPRFAA